MSYFPKLGSLIVFALLASAPLVAQCAGNTYYVSTSGNDSNSGCSTSTAWLTIQHAADTVTAGATVIVEAGTYHESVLFANSGTSSAPIVFNGQGVAVVDGASVACCTTPSFETGNNFLCCNTQGLFTIGSSSGVSYLTIEGFTIQNYKTSNKNYVPAGILIAGSGSGINILNNTVKNIQTSAGRDGNAYGIGVFGTSATPLSVTVSGNTVTGCLTGESETTTYNGNVQNFVVSNNTIHDNDNIGIDAIGFEGVGPTGYDRASYGEISGNTVYNISAIHNPGEGNQYDADGLYCDGCEYVVFERNTVHNCDLNMEAASENEGHDSSYVTIRNNVFYDANTVGISIGGYANRVGGSDHVVVVNNTLYNNNTKNGGGEFQIQYHSGSQSGNIFENNIVYAGTQNVWIYSYVKPTSTYPAPPATLNWNLYYSKAGYVQRTSIDWAGKYDYKTYADYQSGSGEDANSPNANPLFDNVNSKLPNFDIRSSSPATNAGSTSLTCSVGYCGNSNSIYGSTDYAGNPRINSNGQINIGAYEQ
jgi:hypothetical protein